MVILLLGFDTEGARPSDSKINVDKRIRESLSVVSAITAILKEYQVPATFFILGRLLNCAGKEYWKHLG